MPVLDRREPAVYVTIEDASYIAPTLETGRTVYGVTICDRGPHNRITKVTSKAQFHKLFGQPNYERTSLLHYQLDKALDYTSSVLVCRVTPEDAFLSNAVVKFLNGPSAVTTFTDGTYTFTHYNPDLTDPIQIEDNLNKSKRVECDTLTTLDKFEIGDWIFGEGSSLNESRQVISKDTTNKYLILDNPYTGVTNTGDASKYVPFSINYLNGVLDESYMPNTSEDVCYYFYATGVGSYYNNLYIKGSRNVPMEKMFTDDNGEPLYLYNFIDVAVYYMDEDGREKLMEGPWTVSLMRKTPKGQQIRDLTNGKILYIENVINESSDLIRCISGRAISNLEKDVTGESARLQVMLSFSPKSNIVGVSNIAGGGIKLQNGTDGSIDPIATNPVSIYENGFLNYSDKLMGRVAQAYRGDLISADGTIEQIRECTYPLYEPDYIISGGYPIFVQEGARYLADFRQDCIHLADTGENVNRYDKDIEIRKNELGGWNVWTTMLYVQYREMFDNYTGRYIWQSPVYHAIERHLYIDGVSFIAEPVAGIEKGAISDSIKLSYLANHTERGDLQDKELNMVIVEPQGKYILTQLTTWKRLSILKRGHVAKFVAYCRKVIPTLLKDILQRKATQFWINQANFRVTDFLTRFVENPSLERYSILKSFNVNVQFDDVRSELNVYVDITPIRAIERINVFIIVH